MKSKRLAELDHSWSRTLAATFGTIPVSIAVALALALTLPVSRPLSQAVGYHAVFPLWLTSACLVFLARSARSAWLALGSALLLALALSASSLALERCNAVACGLSR